MAKGKERKDGEGDLSGYRPGAGCCIVEGGTCLICGLDTPQIREHSQSIQCNPSTDRKSLFCSVSAM